MKRTKGLDAMLYNLKMENPDNHSGFEFSVIVLFFVFALLILLAI